MIRNLVTFNISISLKVFLFYSKLARKEGTVQLAWKKGIPFSKLKCSKAISLLFFVIRYRFKLVLQLFEKYVVGCPSRNKPCWNRLSQWEPISNTSVVNNHMPPPLWSGLFMFFFSFIFLDAVATYVPSKSNTL